MNWTCARLAGNSRSDCALLKDLQELVALELLSMVERKYITNTDILNKSV